MQYGPIASIPEFKYSLGVIEINDTTEYALSVQVTLPASNDSYREVIKSMQSIINHSFDTVSYRITYVKDLLSIYSDKEISHDLVKQILDLLSDLKDRDIE